MNVIKFDARKLICKDIFRKNQNIEDIYLEIAEVVLVKLYKAFPFNSLFEGFKWENRPNYFFQAALIDWGDCFMSWGLSDIKRAVESVNKLIETNLTPTLGLFYAFYKGNYETIRLAEYEKYINYVYSISKYKNGSQRAQDVLVFGDWSAENANK
jgi:hypothetical protein